MDTNFKNLFLEKWNKFFPKADLPIIFYYTDELNSEEFTDSRYEHRCLINNLTTVREGTSVEFDFLWLNLFRSIPQNRWQLWIE